MELQTITTGNAPLILSLGLPLEQLADEQGASWLDELDNVDVVTGDAAAVAALADRAPTEAAANWLRGALYMREFRQIFTR